MQNSTAKNPPGRTRSGQRSMRKVDSNHSRIDPTRTGEEVSKSVARPRSRPRQTKTGQSMDMEWTRDATSSHNPIRASSSTTTATTAAAAAASNHDEKRGISLAVVAAFLNPTKPRSRNSNHSRLETLPMEESKTVDRPRGRPRRTRSGQSTSMDLEWQRDTSHNPMSTSYNVEKPGTSLEVVDAATSKISPKRINSGHSSIMFEWTRNNNRSNHEESQPIDDSSTSADRSRPERARSGKQEDGRTKHCSKSPNRQIRLERQADTTCTTGTNGNQQGRQREVRKESNAVAGTTRHKKDRSDNRKVLRKSRSMEESSSSLPFETGDDEEVNNTSKSGALRKSNSMEGEDSISYLDHLLGEDDQRGLLKDNSSTHTSMLGVSLSNMLTVQHHPVRRTRNRRQKGSPRQVGNQLLSASCSVLDFDHQSDNALRSLSAAFGSKEPPQGPPPQENPVLDETQRKKKMSVLSAITKTVKRKVLGKSKKDKDKRKDEWDKDPETDVDQAYHSVAIPGSRESGTTTTETAHLDDDPPFEGGYAASADETPASRARRRRPRGDSVDVDHHRADNADHVKMHRATAAAAAALARELDLAADDEEGNNRRRRRREAAQAAAAEAQSRNFRDRSGHGSVVMYDGDGEEMEPTPRRRKKRTEAAFAATTARALARRTGKDLEEGRRSLRTNSQAAAAEAAARARMRARKKALDSKNTSTREEDDERRRQRRQHEGAIMAAAETAKAKARARAMVRTLSNDAAEAAARRRRRVRRAATGSNGDDIEILDLDEGDNGRPRALPDALRRELTKEGERQYT
jgi:hypothetical protein